MVDQPIHIRTLGNFVVERAGQVIETFLTRKTALLLAYLALNPGKHTRERLAVLFWSETTDEQALKNLRTVLSSIRKNSPDAITISRQVVQISPDVWVDARQFEAGCDALFNGQKESLDAMLELVNLYTGEFLADVHINQVDSLQEWMDDTRDRLHQKVQQLLYLITTHCLETGNAYVGVTIARQLIAVNPFWEAAHRQLMKILLRLGQSGEARMQYERLVALLDDELGTKPEQETVILYEQIKSGALPEEKAPLDRIVLPDIPYIPPKADLEALRRMIANPDCRLITLAGIGGVGKTMLATFIAQERQTLNDAVVFISLATVKTAQDLPQIILNSLHVDVRGTASADQLIAELRSRKVLLILDNYEHMLPDTALIERILAEAAGVRLIITSQTALHIRQEWLLQLKGLQVDQQAEAQQTEALDLFRRTVERILPHVDLTPYADDMQQICTFLDGLPLGIVIAASQMKALSPPEILATLQNNMRSFTAPYQDMPVRHQGFASLVDNVFAHLAVDDYQALMALALFNNSFTHDAALVVANIDTATFIRLIDESLIQKVENFRYRIHGILRQFLLDQFAASSDAEQLCQRLTGYYVQWCQQLYRQKKQRDDDMRLIDAEHANIWHLERMSQQEQERYLLEIIPTLQKYWRNRGFAERVVQIVLPALDDDRHPMPLRARAMVECATMLVGMGQQAQAQALCERALVEGADLLYVQVDALQNLARLDMQRGQNEQAWQRLMQVLDLEPRRSSADDPMVEYLFLGNHTGMGLIAMNLEETEIARTHFNIALHSWGQLGEPAMQAQARNNLALLDMREELYDSARQHFEAIVPIIRDAGDDALLASLNGNLARALMMTGEYAQAQEKITEALKATVQLKRKVSTLYQMETATQLAFLTANYAVAAQLYGYIIKHSEADNIAFWSTTQKRMKDYSARMSDTLGGRYELMVNLGSRLSESAALSLIESLSTDSHALK